MSKRRSSSKKKSEEQMLCINMKGLDSLCNIASDMSMNSEYGNEEEEDYDDPDDLDKSLDCAECGASITILATPINRGQTRARGRDMNEPRDIMQSQQYYRDSSGESEAPRGYYQQRGGDSNPPFGHQQPSAHGHQHGHPPPSIMKQNENQAPPGGGGAPCCGGPPQAKKCTFHNHGTTAGGAGCPMANQQPSTQGCTNPACLQARGNCPLQPTGGHGAPPPQCGQQQQPSGQQGQGSESRNPTRHYSVNVTACTIGLEKLEAKLEKKKSIVEISCCFLLKTNEAKYQEDLDNICKTLKSETEKSLQNCASDDKSGGGNNCFQTTMLMNSAAACELRKRGNGCTIPTWVKHT
ncbi:hypothetical protein M8J77_019276 [Diaphorina citri]|nr:hypothetical protein M8J77_019276 [Diaphorina citri]